MRRLFAALLTIAAVGCDGANEIVSSRVPTPTPTPAPTTYVIDGTVTQHGQAASQVRVKAVSGGQTWSAMSASSGAYRIVGLPAGEFQVSASDYYCGIVSKTVALPPSTTVDLDFLMCWRSPDPTKRVPD
jgi:hypothetical protein